MTDEATRGPQSLQEARHRRPRSEGASRIPPHNLEAEESVLGAMLLSHEAVVGAVAAGLTPGAFYKPSHGHIFAAIVSTADGDGRGADPVTVGDELRRQGMLEQVGGPAALVSLQSNTPAVGNAGRYVDIVIGHKRARDVIELGGRVVDAGYAGDFEHVASQVDDLAMVVATVDEGEASSWSPVDLSTLDDEPAVEPTILQRADGAPMLYRGKVHAFNAEAESGKSWLTLWAVIEVIEAGLHAVVVDFEDEARTLMQRLRELGADLSQVLERVHYIRPDSPVNASSAARVRAMLRQWPVGLVVVDGVGAAMASSGWSEDKDSDVQSFFRLLPVLAAREGAAVVIVDHVVKDPEARRGHASGSHAKKDRADVCVEMTVAEPFGRGRSGKVRIMVTKDRPGVLRGGAVGGRYWAMMHLDSMDEGRCVAVTLRVPEGGFTPLSRPTFVMAKVSYLLMMAGGPMSKNALREGAKGRQGKKETVDRALACLVAEGYVEESGEGRLHGYSHVRAFREDQNDQSAANDNEGYDDEIEEEF